MENDRSAKIAERIKEIAAVYLEGESNKSALITVTRVDVLDRGRTAMLYVSVLPEESEESALNFLKRKRADIREEVKRKLNIHPIPFLDVAIDTGEKARNNIEALLRQDS